MQITINSGIQKWNKQSLRSTAKSLVKPMTKKIKL